MTDELASGDGRVVLISGASGFVGRFATRYLAERKWRVKALVRRRSQQAHEVSWDPERGVVAEGALEDVFAVLHLAGESVAGRWSQDKKSAILTSRVHGTRTLAKAIVDSKHPPQVFLSASAIGYYGDRGGEILTEESAAGGDFLASVCKAWEGESAAVDGICRRVNPRLGIVFGPNGGALEAMVRPIQWGVGGKLGDGSQWVSWIPLLDLVRLFEFCMLESAISGAVNAVSPQPVTNAQLTREIADVLNRPAWLSVPKIAVRAVLGEFSTEVLSSKRVFPDVARDAGFTWCHGDVVQALRWSLGVGVNG